MFGAVRFVSKLDIDRQPAQSKENTLAVAFHYILSPYSDLLLPPNAQTYCLSLQAGHQQKYMKSTKPKSEN